MVFGEFSMIWEVSRCLGVLVCFSWCDVLIFSIYGFMRLRIVRYVVNSSVMMMMVMNSLVIVGKILIRVKDMVMVFIVMMVWI